MTQEKVCTACKVSKPLDEFYLCARGKFGRQYHCKPCQNSRYGTDDSHRKRIRRRAARVKAENQPRVDEVKRRYGCVFCKEKEPIALDFHHIDPSVKHKEISVMLGSSWTRIINEMKKCVVVCANCHRKLHGGLIKLTKNTQLSKLK